MIDYVLLFFSSFSAVIFSEIAKDVYHSLKTYFKEQYRKKGVIN